jgi:tyrosine-specific transport protein
MNIGKLIGSAMIVIGSLVGAGMLAFPYVSADAGFGWTTLLMIIIWLTTIFSGLLILEVNLGLPIEACTFSSMAKETLGKFGKSLTWVCYLFLLYAIITSYIVGASNTIASTINPLLGFEIPNWLSSILFTFIFGTIVFWSTQATDYFNRVLLSLKGLLLFATLLFTLPYLEGSKLAASQTISQMNYAWLAVPTFICAFSYQFVIPSIRMYIGDKPKQLKMVMFIGTAVALVIYLWWQASALGIIPVTGENSFESFANGPKPSSLIQAICSIVNSELVTVSIQGFANIALTSSFLCLALALFDFLADGFRRPNTKIGRLQTSIMAFTPPLAVGIFFPESFVKALNFAAVACAILVFILPALMVYNARKNPDFDSPYKCKGGKIVIAGVLLIGVALAVVSVLAIWGLLPTRI